MTRMINKLLLLAAVFILLTACSASKYNKEAMSSMPFYLKVTKEALNNFESQGNYHSAHLLLTAHNSFVYYKIYEVGYDLSTGNYTLKNGILTLRWNKKNTLNAVADSDFYKHYFAYDTPTPFKIEGVKYYYTDTLLTRIKK
ncbi:hypothetical protein [Ferruginibacter albus]|uniref:hypothetical protein n=1 Tax=Ferruginibacter albus TaxID=2875540 RepID=UPI001CC4777E|nr:hypothetical protein [Ferruginibacter albus]UAY50989.1 hypothetical protein K9M53_10355 [Ferruginibacter albus]